MRKLIWTLGILIFAVGASYAIGGRQLFRWRARAAALLEPPTQAQLDRVVVDTSKPKLAEKGAGAPASATKMIGWTLGIFSGVLVLAIATAGLSRKDGVGADPSLRSG